MSGALDDGVWLTFGAGHTFLKYFFSAGSNGVAIAESRQERFVELAEYFPGSAILEEADYVTLHLPAAPDGRPVMGAAEFSKMKRGAYFINAARGTLIDEEALTAALTEGHLHGAGLDVMRDEPPSHDNPLLSLDNVVFSPHNAALTEECAQRMSEISVRNILDTFDGRLDPEFVVNRDVLRQC